MTPLPTCPAPAGNHITCADSHAGGPLRQARLADPAIRRSAQHVVRKIINIGKDQSLQLLRSQGQHDQAGQPAGELPDKVDTGNAQHAGMLSK